MKARAAINSQRGDLTQGKWKDSHETTILYTYGGKFTLINSMATKLPCFTSLPTREKCTWNTSPTSPGWTTMRHKRSCALPIAVANQATGKDSQKLQASVDTTQLRKTMFKMTDSTPDTSRDLPARPGKTREENPMMITVSSWTDLTLHSLVVFSYLVVVSLYHLQEQSWSVLHRFGKYLQQIPLVIKINQNLQLL